MTELELLKRIRDANKAGMTHTQSRSEGGVSVLAQDYLNRFGNPYDAWIQSLDDRNLGKIGYGEDWYGGDLLADTEHYLYSLSHPSSFVNPWWMPFGYRAAKAFGLKEGSPTTRRQLRAGYGLTD